MKRPPSALLAQAQADPLLTPAEVAVILRIDVKTVTRWAKEGKIAASFTAGRHRRYRESEVRRVLDDHREDPGL